MTHPYLGLVQFCVVPRMQKKNHDTVYKLLQKNPPPAQSLILLPELFSTGFLVKKEDLGQVSPGALFAEDFDFLSKIAKEGQWYLSGSTLGLGEGGKFLNLSLTFAPTGELICTYQKIHAFTFAGENLYYQPGKNWKVYPWHYLSTLAPQAHTDSTEGNSTLGRDHQTDLTSPLATSAPLLPTDSSQAHHQYSTPKPAPLSHLLVQPTLCYDLRFPELFRAGLDLGAHIMTIQAHWPNSRQSHWDTLLPARAIENQAIVAGVNVTGQIGTHTYNGGSSIYTSSGDCILHMGKEEACAFTALPHHALIEWRAKFPALKDRHPLNFYTSNTP